MNTKGLSLNTIPPALIPLRFFLSAPLFGILGALLMLFYGADIWSSRWLPSALALTHLITLGFIVMVMIGAMYQFIPVMIGQFIPASEQLVPIIHPLLNLGTLFLTSAFLLHNHLLYHLAFFSLGIALLLFSLSLLPLLTSQIKKHLIVFILRVLFIVISITISLGLYMLLQYAYPDVGINFRYYTDIHASWGLIGWVMLLIMVVSSQVIPMFFVSPEFSQSILKSVSVVIVVTLSLLFFTDHLFVKVVLSLTLSFIALYILSLIHRRKRKLADITINFFRLSLISLLLAVLFWWLFCSGLVFSLQTLQVSFEFTLALLMMYGLAVSAIMGMLQKIVPFLIYLNLHNLSFKHPQSVMTEPKLSLNMKQIITTLQSKIQFFLHLFSYLLLLLSVYFSPLLGWAALLMLCNFSWLAYCLFKGFFFYNTTRRYILTFPEMKMNFGL